MCLAQRRFSRKATAFDVLDLVMSVLPLLSNITE